jgi:hypothetical protein
MTSRTLWVPLLGTAVLACSPAPFNSALSWDGATTTAPPPAAPTVDAGPSGPPDSAPVDVPREVAAAPDTGGGGADSAVEVRPDAVVEARSPTAMCTFRVSVLTRTGNRNYAPRNVGAIYIADETGRFVKSLNVWANRRLAELEKWVAATRAAGVANNRVDAVTAATMTNHAVRMGTWNCTNYNRMVVPDGLYQVCFEMNETNNASQFQCVMFTKGGEPEVIMPPDAPAFSMRRLEYTP